MNWIITIIAVAIFAEASRRSLRNGVLLLIVALPLYLIRLQIGPIPTTTLEVLFIALLLMWGWKKYQGGRDESRIYGLPPLITTGAGLILLGGLIGLTQTSDLLGSLNVLKSFLVEPVILAVIILDLERNAKEGWYKPYLTALAIPTIVASLFAITQFTTGRGLPEAWVLMRRATGPFPYPNALGHFVAPIVTLFGSVLLLKKPRGIERITTIATILLGGIAMILSETESAWIATAGALTLVSVFSIFAHREAIKKYDLRHVLLLTVTLGIIAGAVIPQIRTRVVNKITLQDWSGSTRTAQWEETWNYLTNSPKSFLLGAGPNNYPTAVAPFHTHTHLEIFQYPHNIALNIWVEYGLLGVVGFAVLALALVLVVYKKDAINRVSTALFMAPLVEMTIHGLVDVPYFKNDLSMLTWLLIALVLVSGKKLNLTQSRITG